MRCVIPFNSWARQPSFLTVVFGCLLLLAPQASLAAALPDEIQEHVLDNGMRVLLWPDHDIPNVSVYTFWHVGSRNEAPGITGLAHFFEHMMFNGSKNYPPGAFDRTMEAAGGSNNAYTNRNVTVYQDWVPASALETTLDLERDRIAWLSVDPKVVQSERGVVMSERRRSVEDSNTRLILIQLWAGAFIAHPYQWPVIGWRSDIENWRQEDVENFHDRFYAPNNATMVIVGDFDPSTVLPMLVEKLGSIPSREIGRDVVTVEPPQRGERRIELRKEANLPSIAMAWHVPATENQDTAALQLLDLILTDGESSRLYRRLVDKDELALSLWGSLDEAFDPTLYILFFQLRDGTDSQAAESALYEELQTITAEGVTDRELTKAKNILLADFYRSLSSLNGKAQSLGDYELFHGGWHKLFSAEEDYSRISSKDIQRVAATYLTCGNRTVVTLIPAKEGGGHAE